MVVKHSVIHFFGHLVHCSVIIYVYYITKERNQDVITIKKLLGININLKLSD